MARVHKLADLQTNPFVALFEGRRHGDDVAVSFFSTAIPPGGGPALHVHPYAEVFVVVEGQATFTAGDEELVMDAGNVVVVPPRTRHRFVNSGDTPLHLVAIHPSAEVMQTWVGDG